MTSKKTLQKSDNPNATAKSGTEQEKLIIPDPEGYNCENYQCMRNPLDGSMYYGEVGYLKKETGQVIKHGSTGYTEQIQTLGEEQRLQTYKTVRHGYGLQLYNGNRNDDGILTKYEGNWDRDMKQGHGFAVFADGSTFKGKFKKDVIDGQGTFNWVQGHEYKGQFRNGQMDGEGKFKHSSGNLLDGNFKKNQFQTNEGCYINPLDDENLHKKVISRLVGIHQEQAAAELQLQQQQEIEAEAQAQEMQAELEIQKTIGSTQQFEEEDAYGMEVENMAEMDPNQMAQQDEDF